MSPTTGTRFFRHAATAVCVGALLVVANRQLSSTAVLEATPSTQLGSHAAPVQLETATAVAAGCGHAHEAAGDAAGATPVSLSVSQILPNLENAVADWRTYRPERIMIAPHVDLALEFQMTTVREENGRTVWHGRNALTGALLVTVATENDWHAVLDIPAASTFEFHIAGQVASVAEKSGVVHCGESPVAIAKADLADEIAELAAESETGTDANAHRRAASVDVLFFYDAATFEANGRNRARIETAVAARIEAANLVLENSNVRNFRWRFIAAYQVPEYKADGRLSTDLNAITLTDRATGDFVFEKCELHGADQAMILVSGQRDYAGLAWVPAGADAVAHHAAATWDSSYITMAHELAHNFGCRHDRKSENVDDTDSHAAYGFRFEYRGEDTGTIMSYAPNRVPYFSNPQVSYNGFALGVASGQPGAADNACLLGEKATLMTLFREPCLKPVIVEQPQGGTVSRGSNLALRVTAAGDELAFQWRKNGVAIGGATSADFSKAVASDDDAGSYDVLVTNASGAAVSVAATVAVSAPSGDLASQASTSAQSQAGSGGGGAPGHWYLAALAVAAAIRSFKRRG